MKITPIPPTHSLIPLARINDCGTVIPSVSVRPVVEEADMVSNQPLRS